VPILILKIKMAHHSWIQALLNRTGISQHDLAVFLRVSRSAINMACRNERMLPTHAHLQLIHIEQALQEMQTGGSRQLKNYNRLIKYFSHKAREARYKAAVMERYMEKYEEQQQQWTEREKFWRAAAATLADTPEGKQQAEALELLQRLLSRISNNSDIQYYRYKAQLPLLLQEAEQYEIWVAEWESHKPTGQQG
jgi:transcriptional regulator with XRE-family HTH domain